MRLGGPITVQYDDPSEWVRAVAERGYGAAYCPVPVEADDSTVLAYATAAERANIVIAEVGGWSNPLSSDAATREAALDLNRRALDLADRIGARCAVNIAGSRGEPWDGPADENYSEETFEMIVGTVRDIIDAVGPTRTFYALETMPWIFPDSPDDYLRLIWAIDRDRFGVHLDPVNMINSPRRYHDNTNLLDECFAKLGPHIKSCHAKDIRIRAELTVHLDEVRPGLGRLDYAAYLRGVAALTDDVPVMLEHLETTVEYEKAAEHLRSVARNENLEFRS